MQPILALQVDPLDTLNSQSDSSLLLTLEAQHRGYRIFCYQPHNLSFNKGNLEARGEWANFIEEGDHIFPQIDNKDSLNLNHANLVLIRQDPPFDSRYLANTYLLEQLDTHVRVLNSPHGIRNACEKTIPLAFPNLTPPTLISEDIDAIENFAHEYPAIILKPLFGHGGHNVTMVEKKDYGTIPVLIKKLSKNTDEPIIAQPFLKEIAQGDKRIIMIHGEVVGGYRRIPKAGDIRANAAQGGSAEPCDLTPRDLEICQALSSTLHRLGLSIVGIDVIGDYLIEVNVTSPTGFRILKKFYDINAAKIFFDGLSP